MKKIEIDIWEDKSTILELYLISGEESRPMILVIPGGGYDHISNAEGEPVAIRYNAEGFHTAILKYRVSPYKFPAQLLDVSAAMNHLRDNCDNYKIKKNKICVLGFSAGGHLAGSLAVHYNSPLIREHLKITADIRPDACILCYPVISGLKYAHEGAFKNLLGDEEDLELRTFLSLEKQVHSDVPPTFIWHTIDDKSVSFQNSLSYFNALTENNINCELHLFSAGPHGLSLASEVENNKKGIEYSRVGKWVEMSLSWLKYEMGY